MDTKDYFPEAAGTLKTVRDCLRFAISRFNEAGIHFGHGSDNAYDEAAYLILHTLHLPLDQLDPFLDSALTQSEIKELLTVIGQRVDKRLPAAYLTHEAWLGGHRFYVDERVIVPRSFFAELLDEQMVPWVDDADNITRVLDLCTGSGCLAILAALAFPNASVDAVDISRDALNVARRNVDDYGLQERVHLIESDLFGHEKGAFTGANDGLDATRIILSQAAKHLTPDGILAVEIGHNRATLEATCPTLPFTWLEVEAGEDFVFLMHREDLP